MLSKFPHKLIFPHLQQNHLLPLLHFKTQFQQYLHHQNKRDLTYNLIKQHPPPHHPLFTSQLILQPQPIPQPKPKTKKQSEQPPAQTAYEQLKQIKYKFISYHIY
ncbi:putative dsRNA-binding protein, partial [Staphylococcus aureus]|uniref:putative dsRNA-binding protein n=1 Tax=Staphylococcus aureus TaxID=1280 RepID=UPI0037D9A1C5